MNETRRHQRPQLTEQMIAIAIMSVAIASVVHAQPSASLDMQTLIERALGEPADFTVNNKTLGEAIELISEQTGVPLRIRPGVMDLAPLGPRTTIQKLEIANLPLRDGLARLLSPLGMTFALRADHVEVLAKDCLSALGRPITWDELDTLAALSEGEPGLDTDALQALKPRFRFHVPTRDPWLALGHAFRGAGAGPGDEVLSRACQNLGWTWTLEGMHLVVSDGVDTIRRKLARRIKLRMTNRALLDVMHAVGERVGVAIHTEEGLVSSLPRHLQQNFSINVHDDAALQVIDTISAYTGLDYLIEPGGVFFFNANAALSTGSAEPQPDADEPTANDDDPVVAKMTTTLEDGKTIDWLIRRSELPENLREMRKQELAELFRAIRGPKPQPRP